MKKDIYYIAAIIILVIVCFILFNYFRDAKDAIRRMDSALTEKNAEIQWWVNKNGRTVAQKEAAELRAKEIAEMYPKIAHEIEKDFDIKIRNLKAYIQNEFSAHGSGTGMVTNNHYYDSTSGKTIRFKDFSMDDGYLRFHTRLYDSLAGALYTYTYSDTASTVIHSKRAWIFGKEKLYASTMFRNPSSKITGTTNILVNNYKDKRFSFGISAGWGIVKVGNNVNTGWFLGPSVGYTLIKF